MKTIHKYPLELLTRQIIKLPSGAKILTIQNQFEVACLWAEVDPEAEHKLIGDIYMFSTGHPMPEDAILKELDYISTVKFKDGMFVYHFYGRF